MSGASKCLSCGGEALSWGFAHFAGCPRLGTNTTPAVPAPVGAPREGRDLEDRCVRAAVKAGDESGWSSYTVRPIVRAVIAEVCAALAVPAAARASEPCSKCGVDVSTGSCGYGACPGASASEGAERALDALEDMWWQHAYAVDGHDARHNGGLSANEYAEEVLEAAGRITRVEARPAKQWYRLTTPAERAARVPQEGGDK